MGAITYESIQILGIDNILSIYNVELRLKPNEHGFASITAIVNNTFDNSIIAEKTVVSIKSDEVIIFSGYINNVSISRNADSYIAEIELISCSIEYDLKLKKRSFQDDNMTYLDVINTIQDDVNLGLIETNEIVQQPIESSLFQYDETDWNFLKRQASRLGTSIIPEVKAGYPKIEFGLISKSNGVCITATDYINGISDLYYELGGCESGYEKEYFNYYKVKSYENANIGEQVSINGENLIVIEKYGQIVKGELIFTYVLGNDVLLNQQMIYNTKACGAVLKGTVNDVITDKVKVSLDIDKDYAQSNLKFYDWYTVTGNTMFCMPEKETKVFLNLDDCDGSNPTVINCIRDNGESCADTKVASYKTFQVPSNKKFVFNPEKLSFHSATNASKVWNLEIQDEKYIDYNTKAPLKLNSDSSISFETNLYFMGSPMQILLTDINSNGANLIINNTIELGGKVVNVHATERISFEPFKDAPAEIRIENTKKKLWAKILLAVVVVAAVAITVAAIATGGIAGIICAAGIKAMLGVVATCAVGGGIFGYLSVRSQKKSDAKNGIVRSDEEYTYMFWDKFCTGAILTAPMTLPIPGVKGLFFRLSLVGIGSASYQTLDSFLDDTYGGDFYDKDSSFNGTIIMDVLCAVLGEGIGTVLNGALKCGVGAIGNKLSWFATLNRTAARQYLRETIGVEAMSLYKNVLEKYAWEKAISNIVIKSKCYKIIMNMIEKDAGGILATDQSNRIFMKLDIPFSDSVDTNYYDGDTYISFDDEGNMLFD